MTGDDDVTWNTDTSNQATDVATTTTQFLYQLTKLTLLRATLASARDGSLDPDWRDQFGTAPSNPADPPPDEHHDAQIRAATDLATHPRAAWEPDQHVGWRQSLEAWFDATKQCLIDTEHIERQLCDHTGITLVAGLLDTTIEQDLATASYRAGLAAGGLDVDWYDWLIDRANQWTDTDRRDYQLDLMTLEPSYRDTVQQLPIYWR